MTEIPRQILRLDLLDIDFLPRSRLCSFLVRGEGKWNQHCALCTRSLLALSILRTSEVTSLSDYPVPTHASIYDGK
jgi:hypothetical protein